VAERDRSLALVLLCFLLSGFAALLYQTAWAREFAFVFGTSELAVATVLAAYMGGLSTGAALAGWLAPRIRRPVLTYGLLELGVGASALAVPLAIAASVRLAVALFGGAPEPPDASRGALPLFYLAASFAILLIPTGLMGATLPLLARHAVHTERQLGPRVALLYGLNTAGAVLGTLAAAFVLLPALGLRTTVAAGAGVNGVVFVLAALVARRAPPLPPAPAARRGARGSSWRVWRGRGPELVLVLILASGALSFTYEVLWTRLLGHVLGGSVHAFATMLASFLAGIALGSAAASRWARSREGAARAFAAVQVGIALASLGAYALVDRLPEAARLLDARPTGSLAAGALLAAGVLLPSTLFIGATFPLAVRVLARDERDAGPASALVYAWNTVGAILGAVGAGFFLIPALGYAGAITACAGGGLGLAFVAARRLGPGSRPVAVAAAALLVALALVRPDTPERLLRSSPMRPRPIEGPMIYLGVGRSATVSLIDQGNGWRLRTNGLPEAWILPPGRDPGTSTVPIWLAALPAAARPDLRSLLVVGFGGGVVLEDVYRGVERVDAIELEPEVIQANRRLSGLRARDPLADPRLRIHRNDARGALLLTDRRWDAVVSQPSHPWTAGASHLYTREFFEQVRAHLRPGGVFVQWMGLGFLDLPLTRSLVATLNAVFPYVEVYSPATGFLLFLASEAPLDPAGGVDRARAVDPRPLDQVGVFGREDLAAHRLLDEDGARRFAEGAPLSTDDRNLLQMHALRALRDPVETALLAARTAPFDPLVPPGPELDPVLLVRRLLDTGQGERAARVAGSLERSPARWLSLALVETRRDPPSGRRALEALLARRPGLAEARKALLVEELERDGAGAARARKVAAPLGRRARALAEAGEHARAGAWQELRSLDPALAGIGIRDLLYPAAARLRIRWRLEVGGAAEAERAVALADRLLARRRSHPHRLLRARAVARAGSPAAALGDLEDLVPTLRRAKARPALARSLLAVLEEIPRDPALAGRRAQLERRVRRLEAAASAAAGREPARAPAESRAGARLAPGLGSRPDSRLPELPPRRPGEEG